MAGQLSLIPISQAELNGAAFRLAQLLQQIDDEDDAWDEAKEQHKNTMGALKEAVGEQRATIRRAQLEHEEGLAKEQVDALLNQVDEQRL